jgi:hypothetical protein
MMNGSLFIQCLKVEKSTPSPVVTYTLQITSYDGYHSRIHHSNVFISALPTKIPTHGNFTTYIPVMCKLFHVRNTYQVQQGTLFNVGSTSTSMLNKTKSKIPLSQILDMYEHT